MDRLERPGRGDPLGMHQHLQIARLDFLHGAVEHDPTAVDEHDIGEDVLDLFDLMSRHDDGAVAVEVVVQQRVVELLAEQDVQAEGRLVQQQQSRVDGHDQREVKLGHHALRQFPDLAGGPDGGLRKKGFRSRTGESRMHAADVVERLRDPEPAGQHGDVGDETDVAHELVALVPGVASEHLQLTLIRSEAEKRVDRGGLARAVGTDEPEDAALFDTQIEAVEGDGRPEGLAEAACFYACHRFSAPPLPHPTPAAGRGRPPAALPVSGRAAEWLRGPGATLRPGTSGARPAEADRARRH